MGRPARQTQQLGRQLKLRQLEVLLAVAQWGSMARAAEHLAITQPVVSKTIADLEHIVGVQLLDRTPHGRNEDGLPIPVAWVRRHDEYDG